MQDSPRIMINNGELFMADGSNLKEYLMTWQLEQEIPNGAMVFVVEGETFQRMQYLLAIAYNK